MMPKLAVVNRIVENELIFVGIITHFSGFPVILIDCFLTRRRSISYAVKYLIEYLAFN